MFGISYWVLPVVSALMWLATILALLLKWVTDGEPHYASMDADQNIAYISDVGAQSLKPLFIAGSCVTVVCLDLAMIAERWLRHRGRLAPNTSWWQEALSVIAILASIAGGAGLILLSIFDTLRHPHLHDAFLVLFIAGYVVSAIFICAEYQRLGMKYRQHVVLRASFWLKLGFILIEVALAIPFGILNSGYDHPNVAAVLEWVIAFIFTFYVLTFFLDLLPAIRTKHHASKEPMTEAGFAPSEGTYTNGSTNGYTNGSEVDGYHAAYTRGDDVFDAHGNKIPQIPAAQNF